MSEDPKKGDWLSQLSSYPLREDLLYMSEDNYKDLLGWVSEGRLIDVSMGCKVAEDPKTKFDQLYQGVVPEGINPCVEEFRPEAVTGRLRYIGPPRYVEGIPPRVDIPVGEGPSITRDWGMIEGETLVNPSFVKLKRDKTKDG